MPQRFLRPGITTSDRWNAVSWNAQSLYVRIITIVDDYGRCDGRASVINGVCMSVWNELNPENRSDPQETAALLQQLAAKKLIDLYESDGKKVLQVTQWQERIRDGAKERWPSKQNPQESAGIRSVPLPPSSPSPTAPSSLVPRPSSPNGGIVMVLSFGAALMKFMNRTKESDRLTHYEESLVSAIIRERPDYLAELTLLKSFKSTVRHFPQSLTKLLEGWQEQLDRAANQPKKENKLLNGRTSLMDQEADRLLRLSKNL